MSVLPHVFSSSYSFTDADDADDANAVYDDAKVYSDAVQCIRVQCSGCSPPFHPGATPKVDKIRRSTRILPSNFRRP